MTSNGKASDQLLTEEAYAAGNTAGRRVFPPQSIPWSWEHHAHLKQRRLEITYPSIAFYDQCRAEYDSMVTQHLADTERYIEYMEGYLAWRKKQRRLNASGENQHQLGPREFTLTYSTQWGWDDEEAQETMRSAIEKLTRYYKDEIIEFHAIGEYGRDGRSHVHGWYHLNGGRKITDKNFRRAYPRWNPKRKLGKGFEGGHHQTIERVSDFAGYAEKHLDEAWMKTDITNAVLNAPPHTTQGILGREFRDYEETRGSTCRSPSEASDEDSD